MNYEISKITTPSGQIRHQLRVWNYGPDRVEMKRRFEDKKELFKSLDVLQKSENDYQGEPIKFGDLYNDWLDRQAITFSPSWRKTVVGFWSKLKPKLEFLSPGLITPDFLRTLERDLLIGGNSQKTANLKIGFILAVLNFAVSVDRITKNNAAQFKMKKPEPTQVQFWEKEDAESFLLFTDQKYNRNSKDRWKHSVYMVGINAALRAGEIWALRPRCLKHSLGVIRIEEQFDRVGKTFRITKGKDPRNVPLNDALARELAHVIESKGIGRNDLIFTNQAGQAINHRNFYRRVFEKDIEEWKGPEINFHGLRHTGATLMLDAGVSLKTVKDILGHKDIATTARYLHLLSSSVKRAADNFSVSPQVNRHLEIVRQSSS